MSIDIEIDDVSVARLEPGEQRTIRLDPGRHTIRAYTGAISSGTWTFNLALETIHFEIALSYEDWRSRLFSGAKLYVSPSPPSAEALFDKATERNPLGMRALAAVLRSSKDEILVAGALTIVVVIAWGLYRTLT